MRGALLARSWRQLWVSAVLLAGCGLVDAASSPVVQIEAVQVRSTDNSNSNSPTALDLVFVYDPGVVDAVQALTAAQWFERRRQLVLDFPDGIGVQSWEIVPDTILPVWQVPEDMLENKSGDDAVAAFVFADYLSPGAHRARLESRLGLRIDLQRDDFILTPFNPDS